MSEKRERHHEVAYVLVRVEAIATDDDFGTDAVCAVSAALQGLDVPGATVLRASVQPHDGEMVRRTQ